MASFLFISAAQCRAARGLLGWTQQDLAKATGLSKTAIVQFETGLARTRDDTLAQIALSLIQQGIEFVLPEGVNRRAVTSQLFADDNALQNEWPAFLKSFSTPITIKLMNWPDFADEFKGLTNQQPHIEIIQTVPHYRAALVGDWLIMPLVDTAFRVAVYTAQWQKYLA